MPKYKNSPKDGNQWKIGKDTVNEFIERGDLLKKDGKVYRKIRPNDESYENIKPFGLYLQSNLEQQNLRSQNCQKFLEQKNMDLKL